MITNGSESKISVGSTPVWTGVEGVFAVPAHWRLGCRLCVAENSDLRIGQTDQTARATARSAGTAKREIEKTTGDDADRAVVGRQHQEAESRSGPAADFASLAPG